MAIGVDVLQANGVRVWRDARQQCLVRNALLARPRVRLIVVTLRDPQIDSPSLLEGVAGRLRGDRDLAVNARCRPQFVPLEADPGTLRRRAASSAGLAREFASTHEHRHDVLAREQTADFGAVSKKRLPRDARVGPATDFVAASGFLGLC